jgi:hypothetical protein
VFSRAGAPVPLLLDAYGSGIAAAISTTRILKTGVTNNLTVRRSTGGETTYTPAQILAGDHITYVGAGNDGFITSAIDQSGNGRNLVQTSTSNQPKIVNAGTGITSNGKPAIKFQGNSQFLLSSNFTSTVNRTFIIVLEQFDTSASSWKGYMRHSPSGFADNTINGIIGFFNTNNLRGYVGSGSANTSTANTTLALSTRYIIEMYVTGGSNLRLYVNGTSIENKTITISPQVASNPLIISLSGAGNANHQINVLEALYWTEDKFSDRAAIYADLNAYYS